MLWLLLWLVWDKLIEHFWILGLKKKSLLLPSFARQKAYPKPHGGQFYLIRSYSASLYILLCSSAHFSCLQPFSRMLNRKFPLWGTRVPDDMPLRLTLLALPRVNRMEFLAPERGGKMLESVHPSNQAKSPLFPSICSTPGDVSTPSSPRCFLKNTRGGRKVCTRKTEHLDSPGWRLTQGFTLCQ